MENNAAEKLSAQLSDLKSCEQEPVHFIGSVQGHGCLLCFSLPDRRIQAASENIKDFLELKHSEVVSAKLDHVVDPQFADQVVNALERPTAANRLHGTALKYETGDQSFGAYVYKSQGLYCLELEKNQESKDDADSSIADEEIVRDGMMQLRDSERLRDSGTIVCRTVRALTGFDRVMLYRFIAPNMHGEVIAEDRVIHAHSYDQHRFPASDIPRIARDLYLRNGVRAIPDISAEISKITPSTNPLTRAPLDLSDSRIRAVSPIHLEYLKNMKVGASYSFAIIVKGELWGLVACHHLSPLQISASKRRGCELIANGFAAHAPLIEQVDQQQHRIGFGVKLRKIVENLRFSSEPVSEMFKNHQVLLDAFNATGVAYVTDNSIDLAGLVPPAAQLKTLADFLREKILNENKNVTSVDNLNSAFPAWIDLNHVACGVLALDVGGVDRGIFLIFRPEQIETIVWGGDPRKQLDKKGFTGRIHPRASFNTWEETIRGHSAEWARFEVEGAGFIKEMVFETLAPRQKLIQELTSNRNKS